MRQWVCQIHFELTQFKNFNWNATYTCQTWLGLHGLHKFYILIISRFLLVYFIQLFCKNGCFNNCSLYKNCFVFRIFLNIVSEKCHWHWKLSTLRPNHRISTTQSVPMANDWYYYRYMNNRSIVNNDVVWFWIQIEIVFLVARVNTTCWAYGPLPRLSENRSICLNIRIIRFRTPNLWPQSSDIFLFVQLAYRPKKSLRELRSP